MKIVLATPTVAPEAGGPAFFVRDLAAALSERGHDIALVAHGTEDAAAVSYGVAFRIVSTVAPKGPFGWTKGLRQCLAEELADADAVFIHGIWQEMAMAAAHEARRAGVPYVVFPHGMLDPYIINRTRLHAVARWVQLRLYQARDLRSADAVVFTTEPEMAKALTVVPELAPNSRRMRYGTVDPGIEPRLDVSETSPVGPMTIGYLGRLHPKKNLVAAVRAMTAFSPAEVHFEIVGPPSDYLVALQATVDELRLGDRVSFYPPVFDDQKFVMMRRWDWLLLPSLQENFGQVLAQALSVGTPVIVSDRIDTCAAIVSSGAGIASQTGPGGIQAAVRRAHDEFLPIGVPSRRLAARRAFEQLFCFSHTIDDALDVVFGVV